MSFAEKQRMALQVRCPCCAATVGQRCFRPWGQRREAHVLRVLGAAEANGIKRGAV